MRKDEFKVWLINQKCYSSKKLVFDCISRVKRAEECLCAAIDQIEDFDSAFSKDGGRFVKSLLSCHGAALAMGGYDVNLPVGSNQMDAIVAAVRKYFLFLKDEQNREKE